MWFWVIWGTFDMGFTLKQIQYKRPWTKHYFYQNLTNVFDMICILIAHRLSTKVPCHDHSNVWGTAWASCMWQQTFQANGSSIKQGYVLVLTLFSLAWCWDMEKIDNWDMYIYIHKNLFNLKYLQAHTKIQVQLIREHLLQMSYMHIVGYVFVRAKTLLCGGHP